MDGEYRFVMLWVMLVVGGEPSLRGTLEYRFISSRKAFTKTSVFFGDVPTV